MSNAGTIILELGPETQKKLDKILEALEGINRRNCENCVESATAATIYAMKDVLKQGAKDGDVKDPESVTIREPVKAPGNAGEVPEEEPKAKENEPTSAENGPDKPEYTKRDIQVLVQKLAAPKSPPDKRAGAKKIVKSYGAKVSDIPVDKYHEVMERLIALDKEGME